MATFEKVGECLYRYLPTGRYYARFEANGREVRRSLGTTDRALAKRRLADLHRDLGKVDRDAAKATLGQMCARYMETIQSQAPQTLERKRIIAGRLKRDFPGGLDVPLAKVVPSKIAAWLASYDFSAASYNHYLIFIRQVFALAVGDRLLASSPVDAIKMKRVPTPVRKTPTVEEFNAVVADIRALPEHLEGQHSADFVEFVGLAGLGLAEAAALRWGDIHWEREQITTFRHKTRHGFVIPIYPQLRPLLERLRQDRGGSPDHGEKVFRIMDPSRGLTGACRRLGLPRYTLRSFRRMFITRAIEKGVDVKVIAQWQGHQDGGRLILNTYSHVQASHADRMARLME